jgi:hypothetical protein
LTALLLFDGLASFISNSFLKGLAVTVSFLALPFSIEVILWCLPPESGIFSPGLLPFDVRCWVMRPESQPLHLPQF